MFAVLVWDVDETGCCCHVGFVTDGSFWSKKIPYVKAWPVFSACFLVGLFGVAMLLLKVSDNLSFFQPSKSVISLNKVGRCPGEKWLQVPVGLDTAPVAGIPVQPPRCLLGALGVLAVDE